MISRVASWKVMAAWRQKRRDPATLEELGHHYGISRERVRQLEVRAFQRVRNEFAGVAAVA